MIVRSSGWDLLQSLWKLRLILAPHDSRRERALLWTKHGLRQLRTKGVVSLSQAIYRHLRLGPAGVDPYRAKFLRFRATRRGTHPTDLSSLSWPSTPGLVSVVLPAYNGAAYLRESVDSILEQTYREFELIAIDDGSTDETAAILDEYARRDPRVRVLHQEHRNLPGSLSRGFRLAGGEFLTWTSADNRMKRDFLAKMVASIRRHPSWDMIYANEDIIDEAGLPLRLSNWYEGYQDPPGSEHIHLPGDPSLLNTWPNNYVGAAFLYRARVAFLLGDYARHRFTLEDYDYWLRLNELLCLRHADFTEPVYEYRFHSGSLTAKDGELAITERRPRLMMFDDFRRDLILSPLIWILDADPDSVDATRLLAALRRSIEKAGGLVFDAPTGQRFFMADTLDACCLCADRLACGGRSPAGFGAERRAQGTRLCGRTSAGGCP